MADPRPPMHFPESWSAFGPKVQALRSDRERRFAWAYLMNSMADLRPNGAQAARDAGYSDTGDGCKVRASELLARNDVVEALQELSARQLRGLAVPAVAALSRLVQKEDHAEHRKAVEMVLDRVGLGPKSTVEVNHTGTVTLNHTDEAVEQLRVLLELGVPREKLVETFGFSGLGRYERMLAEQQGKRLPAPAVIEGEEKELGGG